MAYFDLPLEKLLEYKPERHEEKDFDEFWKKTLEESMKYPLDPVFEREDFFLKTVEVYDVTYSGYMGQRIKGWLLVPACRRTDKLPCIVQYVGYRGGRGFPYDWLLWSSAGYAHFVMDTRGQGTSRTKGDTPDVCEWVDPQYPGFMTRGILDPRTYYYRRVFTDAVRAVEAAASFPLVDPERIAVAGASQGGGIALAVSALSPLVKALICDVPFLCHFRRAVQIVDTMPYGEIVQYLKVHRDKVDVVFKTLSYFDGVNFAVRAKVPALFSVALMDKTCPPSTVFAAYNHYAGPKEIKIYPYNEHEGGESFQTFEELKFMRKIFMEG